MRASRTLIDITGRRGVLKVQCSHVDNVPDSVEIFLQILQKFHHLLFVVFAKNIRLGMDLNIAVRDDLIPCRLQDLSISPELCIETIDFRGE